MARHKKNLPKNSVSGSFYVKFYIDCHGFAVKLAKKPVPFFIAPHL